MQERHQELEFAALRATIRERGTVRILLAWATFVVWAGLFLASLTWTALPAASLVSLLVLAAAFEAIVALHTGVERVGRYLQVRYEKDSTEGAAPEGWESAAMRYGGRFGGGSDPLFSALFAVAAALNYFPVLAEGVAAELAGIGVFHAAFVGRVLLARRRAGRQRAEDLERFRTILR